MYDAPRTASACDVLVEALRLLLDKGISHGAFARDIDGNVCGSHHRDAECFCVIGAISHANLLLTGEEFADLNPVYDLLKPYLDMGQITHWNDEASDREIVSVIRSSINYEVSRLEDLLL